MDETPVSESIDLFTAVLGAERGTHKTPGSACSAHPGEAQRLADALHALRSAGSIAQNGAALGLVAVLAEQRERLGEADLQAALQIATRILSHHLFEGHSHRVKEHFCESWTGTGKDDRLIPKAEAGTVFDAVFSARLRELTEDLSADYLRALIATGRVPDSWEALCEGAREQALSAAAAKLLAPVMIARGESALQRLLGKRYADARKAFVPGRRLRPGKLCEMLIVSDWERGLAADLREHAGPSPHWRLEAELRRALEAEMVARRAPELRASQERRKAREAQS